MSTIPGPNPEAPPDWKTAYPPEAWKRIQAEGLYLAIVLIVAVLLIEFLLGYPLSRHQLVEQLLWCGVGGVIGSWIFSVKWYVRAITHKIWRYDLIAWRLTSPWMGIFLAVSTYVLIKTGVFGVTFNKTAGEDERLYAYAIGFLVGLFSDVVMGKLTEVAQTLFGRAAREEITKTRS
jgi:hypothetical protein